MGNEKIQERKAIINKLKILQEKKCPIKAKLNRNESLVTAIVGINVEEGTLMLAYNETEPILFS